MRRRGKVDANQAAIVQTLRRVGASVESIADVGAGCPDLLVGRDGVTYLLEVKGPQGKLTPAERDWAVRWRGNPVRAVRDVEDALCAIGVMSMRGERPVETMTDAPQWKWRVICHTCDGAVVATGDSEALNLNHPQIREHLDSKPGVHVLQAQTYLVESVRANDA